MILFLLPLFSRGANIYISGTGNNTTGNGTIGAPYQTIAKLNTLTLSANDVILFERGYTYYGSIVPQRSNLIYDSYGTGPIAHITGFETITGFSFSGSGVYLANVSAASTTLKNVVIDGAQQIIGRYPNYNSTDGGYLTYESFSAGTSITDASLSTVPYNWAGADAVIVKQPWVIDVCPITTHVGGTLTYTNVSSQPGKAGYGYFIQNDLRTLDSYGEWFLNKSTKDLSIYFGGSSPGSHVIQVSTVNVLFDAGGGASPYSAKSNITVQNLKFSGANGRTMWFQDASNINVNNCQFDNNNLGIYAWHIINVNISYNVTHNNLSTPIQVMQGDNGTTNVSNNTVENVGLFAGMGLNGDDADHAIEVRVGAYGATIENNSLENIGWNGISFYGSHILVQNNFINNFGITKSDCGAIYTYLGSTDTDRRLLNNICGNGVTSFGWPYSNILEEGATHGIYFDGVASNAYIKGNSLFNIPGGGFFTNESSNLYITINTFYNVVNAVKFQRFDAAPLIRNIILSRNVISSSHNNIFYWNQSLNTPTTVTIQNDYRALFSRIDSNYYMSGASQEFHYWYHTSPGVGFVDGPNNNGTPIYWASWPAFINGESHSTYNTFTPVFVYNATQSYVPVNFSGFKRIDVMTGISYDNTYSLPPMSSVLFKPNGTASIPGGSGSIYRSLIKIKTP